MPSGEVSLDDDPAFEQNVFKSSAEFCTLSRQRTRRQPLTLAIRVW
jgi:hypothetical protein